MPQPQPQLEANGRLSKNTHCWRSERKHLHLLLYKTDCQGSFCLKICSSFPISVMWLCASGVCVCVVGSCLSLFHSSVYCKLNRKREGEVQMKIKIWTLAKFKTKKSHLRGENIFWKWCEVVRVFFSQIFWRYPDDFNTFVSQFLKWMALFIKTDSIIIGDDQSLSLPYIGNPMLFILH